MRAFLTIILCSASVALAAQTGTPLITSQDLLDGLKDPTRWLTYGGDYNSQRHSPLTQITPENVNQLTAQWTFQTGTTGSFQTTPLVVDGVLYVTGYNNNAWAVDARSGRQIWRYRREIPEDWKGCCGAVNRGFGVLGDRLFMKSSISRSRYMFSAIIAPMMFFGCAYYPWRGLDAVPVMKYLVLINPLVYVAEGMRGALTPEVPHMLSAPRAMHSTVRSRQR